MCNRNHIHNYNGNVLQFLNTDYSNRKNEFWLKLKKCNKTGTSSVVTEFNLYIFIDHKIDCFYRCTKSN